MAPRKSEGAKVPPTRPLLEQRPVSRSLRAHSSVKYQALKLDESLRMVSRVAYPKNKT